MELAENYVSRSKFSRATFSSASLQSLLSHDIKRTKAKSKSKSKNGC